jgi:hypothetical protein
MSIFSTNQEDEEIFIVQEGDEKLKREQEDFAIPPTEDDDSTLRNENTIQTQQTKTRG